MTDLRAYSGHGLVVASDMQLNLREIGGTALPDVTIESGDIRSVPRMNPDADVLLERVWPEDGGFQALERGAEGLRLVLSDIAELTGDQEFRRIVAHPADETKRELLPVIAEGIVLSLHLYLAGHPVLHASAVDVGGQALAFVGASGMGKSTMATILAMAGAKLVTDDVLRIHLGDVVEVFPGATGTRLRQGARQLLGGAGSVPVRKTADDRTMALLSRSEAEILPLSAIAIPTPDRTSSRVTARRLTGVEALKTLLSYPRMIGWLDKDVLSEQFQVSAELVRRTPIWDVSIPWGPPFDQNLAEELCRVIDVEFSAQSSKGVRG